MSTSQHLRIDLPILHLNNSFCIRLLPLLIRLQLRPQTLRIFNLGDFAEQIACGNAEGFETPDVAGFGEVFVECAARILSEKESNRRRTDRCCLPSHVDVIAAYL